MNNMLKFHCMIVILDYFLQFFLITNYFCCWILNILPHTTSLTIPYTSYILCHIQCIMEKMLISRLLKTIWTLAASLYSNFLFYLK